MCPHIIRGQPTFRCPRLVPFGKFIHQADGGLRPLVVLDIYNGIPAPIGPGMALRVGWIGAPALFPGAPMSAAIWTLV